MALPTSFPSSGIGSHPADDDLFALLDLEYGSGNAVNDKQSTQTDADSFEAYFATMENGDDSRFPNVNASLADDNPSINVIIDSPEPLSSSVPTITSSNGQLLAGQGFNQSPNLILSSAPLLAESLFDVEPLNGNFPQYRDPYFSDNESVHSTPSLSPSSPNPALSVLSNGGRITSASSRSMPNLFSPDGTYGDFLGVPGQLPLSRRRSASLQSSHSSFGAQPFESFADIDANSMQSDDGVSVDIGLLNIDFQSSENFLIPNMRFISDNRLGSNAQVILIPSPLIRCIPSPQVSPLMTGVYSDVPNMGPGIGESAFQDYPGASPYVPPIRYEALAPPPNYLTNGNEKSFEQLMAEWEASISGDSIQKQDRLILPEGEEAVRGIDGVDLTNVTSENVMDYSIARKKGRTNLYQCPKCGKAFTRPYALKSHYRGHSGERPFICDHTGCNLSFSRKHDLKRHVHLHKGKKEFICKICDKGFARSDALTRHMKTNDPAIPSPCGLKILQMDPSASLNAKSANKNQVRCTEKKDVNAPDDDEDDDEEYDFDLGLDHNTAGFEEGEMDYKLETNLHQEG